MAEVFTATVAAVAEPAPHVRALTLSCDTPLDFAPGQWLSLQLPVGEKPPLVRAYSLAAPPVADGTLELCFDRVDGGLGSSYLWTLEPGATIDFSGPLGNFTLPRTEGDLVFAARFTGIVPFRAMLRALDDASPAVGAPTRTVHLVYGASRPDEMVYHDELTELAARVSWLDYHPVFDGTELDVLERFAPGWMPFTPMVCGVRDFTLPVRTFFQERLGFERRAVKLENYNGPGGGAR